MPINYLPNDPAAAGSTIRRIKPAADRPSGKVTFSIRKLPAERPFEPGTNEFVAWQAREAALRSLNAFEALSGRTWAGWGGSKKRLLALLPNAGEDLNAYYDRASVSFFEYPVDGRPVFSGASTDVVAHEVGHAILDALRPDLWDAKFFEVPAFHEGFGDCIALMTALSDSAERTRLLAASPTLGTANFVEATAEQLATAIGIVAGPTHNAALPRRALNTHQWALPQSLPSDGPPDLLINEIHSFGQLTSGCYYELIREIFLANQGGGKGLLAATRTATSLLAEAVVAAPIQPRFLEAIGRTMILVDRKQFNAANEAFIRTAFERHGIALQIGSFLAPRIALPDGGARPGARAGGTAARGGKARDGEARAGESRAGTPAAGRLGTRSREFLQELMNAGAHDKLVTAAFDASTDDTCRVTACRPVDLSGVSPGLNDVICYSPYSTLVGTRNGAPAVLGSVDPDVVIANEVRQYIATLVRRGQVDLTPPDKGKAESKVEAKGRARAVGRAGARRSARGAGVVSLDGSVTHALYWRAGEQVLERFRFSCGCHRVRPGWLRS